MLDHPIRLPDVSLPNAGQGCPSFPFARGFPAKPRKLERSCTTGISRTFMCDEVGSS